MSAGVTARQAAKVTRRAYTHVRSYLLIILRLDLDVLSVVMRMCPSASTQHHVSAIVLNFRITAPKIRQNHSEFFYLWQHYCPSLSGK